MARRHLSGLHLLGLLVFAVLAFLFAVPQDVGGQEQPTLEVGSPRAAMRGYLEAMIAGDDAAGARFLNLRGVKPAEREVEGPRLARQLKTVLDRTLWVDWESMSDDPEGNAEDGLPRRVDSAGTIEAQPPVPVLLKRVQTAEGPVWLIDSSTVAQIPRLYDEFGHGRLGEWLPELFFTFQILYLEIWQWLGLILAVLLAYALGTLASLVVLRTAKRLVARTETRIDDRLLHAISAPLTASFSIGAFFLLSLALQLSIPARRVIGGACQGLLILTITWLAMRVLDVVAGAMEERLTQRGDTTAATVIPMGRRIAKVFLIIIAGLSALQNLGFNITGLVAGLGIGGLAVALAAQKLFEDFFGGLSIIADRPIQVGEFGRFGDHVGTVEAVGLRSTRIRSLDRTLVTVPNSAFASSQIENFGVRDRIRFFAMLGLRYETSSEQLRHVLIEIKRLLASHSRVLPDPARVRFVGFGAYSLDLELFAYTDTSDWNEFLKIREDLLLHIMDIVEASGSGFAFPSQTMYLGKDDGLDAERTRAAEEQVRQWRSSQDLCLPDYPPERLTDLARTIPFPPEGSVATKGG
jgi:MscS family membrane protein